MTRAYLTSCFAIRQCGSSPVPSTALRWGKLIFKVCLRLSETFYFHSFKIESKLLKTGAKYTLGRKDRQLVVNHKKISHDHAVILVGPYSQDDVVSTLLCPYFYFYLRISSTIFRPIPPRSPLLKYTIPRVRQ